MFYAVRSCLTLLLQTSQITHIPKVNRVLPTAFSAFMGTREMVS